MDNIVIQNSRNEKKDFKKIKVNDLQRKLLYGLQLKTSEMELQDTTKKMFTGHLCTVNTNSETGIVA